MNLPKKIIFLLFLTTFSARCFAQETETDSLFAQLETEEGTNLLPEKLSPVKSIFWGKKGFWRITGLAPLTPEKREKELKLRRRMLVTHQVMGFVTLAGFAVTDFAGQMTISSHEQYGSFHKGAAAVTLGTYATTALLALMAPPPLVKREGWSNIKTHKLLAYLHFAGMVLTPLIAPSFAGGDIAKEARFHQISAYATTAIYGAAIIAIKFR